MTLLDRMFAINKVARRTEADRLGTVLSRQTAAVRQAFTRFLADARSDATMAEVRSLLADGNVQAALKVVDDHVAPLGRTISQALATTASQETALLNRTTNSRVALVFDPSRPDVARLMQSNQLQFVRQMTTQQRAAIQTALANAARDGLGVRQTADSFKNAIGLTQNQVAAVDNYRTLLEQGSSDALDRELRARRYDRAASSAFEDGEPLPQTTIDRMVDAYRNNLLSYRAETIAQTEGLSVVSQARQESAMQVMDQAGFAPEDVTKTWNTTMDGRERDSHASLDGQTVAIDEPFVTAGGVELMYPGDPNAPASERINCRCSVTYNYGSSSDNSDDTESD